VNKRVALGSFTAGKGSHSIYQVRRMKLEVRWKSSAEKRFDKVVKVCICLAPTFIRHADPADDKNGLFSII
jgi:hypothetical protein